MTLFMDRALAERLDAALVAEGVAYVAAWRRCRPEDEPALRRMGGGCLLFTGADSPVTQAVGLGMAGPVSDVDLEAMERFFFGRTATPRVTVNPMAHPSLVQGLRRRGYVLEDFEGALVCSLNPEQSRTCTPAGPVATPATVSPPGQARTSLEPPRELTIRRVGPEDVAIWAPTIARGFEGLQPGTRPGRMELTLAEVALNIEFAESYLAEVDGAAAGGGSLAIHDGIATCFGDATLPEFRGRGVQSALLRHRLARGAEAGCDLAASGAAPGSGSQRNMERLGFRVAYTVVMLTCQSYPRA